MKTQNFNSILSDEQIDKVVGGGWLEDLRRQYEQLQLRNLSLCFSSAAQPLIKALEPQMMQEIPGMNQSFAIIEQVGSSTSPQLRQETLQGIEKLPGLIPQQGDFDPKQLYKQAFGLKTAEQLEGVGIEMKERFLHQMGPKTLRQQHNQVAQVLSQQPQPILREIASNMQKMTEILDHVTVLQYCRL